MKVTALISVSLSLLFLFTSPIHSAPTEGELLKRQNCNLKRDEPVELIGHVQDVTLIGYVDDAEGITPWNGSAGTIGERDDEGGLQKRDNYNGVSPRPTCRLLSMRGRKAIKREKKS